jgi:hypothetical protein
MSLRISTEPTEEPVTLAEAKLHLRIDEIGSSSDGHPDDSLVSVMTTAARDWAEHFLRRSLVTKTYELTLDEFADEIRVRGGQSGRGEAAQRLPDEHLGRNTACLLGMDPADPVVWDPRKADLGGIDPDALAASEIVLWKGFCNVHTGFTVRQVEEARAAHEDVTVIVHPECPRPVVEAADEDGSTEYIIRRLDEMPAGSTVAIGTDWNLVDRLRINHPDKTVFCLKEDLCPCVTMNRITLPKLTWTLENLAAGEVMNVVSVDADMAAEARLALDRMLAL